jgi:hypothetical protein
MTDPPDRRTNPALRRRIDELIDRVHDARAEIVERGLNAVRDPDHDDGDDRADADRRAGDRADDAGPDGARPGGAPRASRARAKAARRDDAPDGAGR